MAHELIETVQIDDIYLDTENPRLPTSLPRSQKDMALYIARHTSITELMTSIAENDYFPGEPIIVVPRAVGGYIVVEGNRRLTAIKLLNDSTLYPQNSRVRRISETAKHKPDSVPCVIFETRGEIVNYLGYRHISGVKQWDPLAKARYIAMYFETKTSADREPIDRYREVARGIGSQYPYIKRQLDGYAIYQHIESAGFYEIQSLNEESISFSLLSTAIGYDAILKFVSSTQHPFIEPHRLKPDSVRQLSLWMYARNEFGETILGDSRNIQRLALIVADQGALESLTNFRNLKKAFAKTRGVSDEFSDLLSEVEWRLGEAMSTVALVDLDEIHSSKILTIFRQAKQLMRASEDD